VITILNILLDLFAFYMLIFAIVFFSEASDLLVILFICIIYFFRLKSKKKAFKNIFWYINEFLIVIGVFNIYFYSLDFSNDYQDYNYFFNKNINSYNIIFLILSLELIKLFIFIKSKRTELK